MPANKNPFLWSALVIVTVIAGGTAAILVAGKEKYFPSLYGHHQSAHAADDSTRIPPDTTSVAHSGSDPALQPDLQSETKPEETQSAAPSSQENPGAGEYVLVAGSFLSHDYAESFRGTISSKIEGISPELKAMSLEGSTYYRVIVQHSKSWSAVATLKERLIGEGFTSLWIYREGG